jgi:hypothetical protein
MKKPLRHNIGFCRRWGLRETRRMDLSYKPKDMMGINYFLNGASF